MNEFATIEAAAETEVYRILSIDAWREPDGGWTWNNWYHVADFPMHQQAMLDKPRELLRWMREVGLLADGSKGNASVEDDGYNVVIRDRRTSEPVYAIEYGAAE